MAYTAELAYGLGVYSGPLAETSVLLRRIEPRSRAETGPNPFAPNSEMPCAIAEAFDRLSQVPVSLKPARSGRELVEVSLDGDRLAWSL